MSKFVKINHHQIKNAVAHISKKVEKDFPNTKHRLRRAYFEFSFWRIVVYESNPLGSLMTYIDPRYGAFLADIGTDESISLENIYVETLGISKVLDSGFGFMNHADKITSASLIKIEELNTRHYPSWILRYSGLDNKQMELEMDISISNQGMIFDVELDYTKGEKARELAKNFIKQSDEILNAIMIWKYYNGNTGIHTLWYKGFSQQGEASKLSLKVDANQGIIISSKIRVLNSESK